MSWNENTEMNQGRFICKNISKICTYDVDAGNTAKIKNEILHKTCK